MKSAPELRRGSAVSSTTSILTFGAEFRNQHQRPAASDSGDVRRLGIKQNAQPSGAFRRDTGIARLSPRLRKFRPPVLLGLCAWDHSSILEKRYMVSSMSQVV